MNAERIADPKSVTPLGWRAYSQHDQDGILDEIFRRIGATNHRFLECGCGDGTENNTVYLLLTGWTGSWLDGSESNIATVNAVFADQLREGKLKAECAFLTRNNISPLVHKLMPEDSQPDLLSIDIDGNDYWTWESMAIRARVVVIEYNPTFRPPHSLVQRYNEAHRWNGTNYFGASLKALEELGRKKGYILVGCNYAGTDAFFVLAEYADQFSPPFTAEHHYRQARYEAFPQGISRHTSGIGAYVRPAITDKSTGAAS